MASYSAKSSSSIASLLFSKRMLTSSWPSTAQRPLKTSSFSISRAISTAAPRVKNGSFKKDLCWVSRPTKKKPPVHLSLNQQEAAVSQDSFNGHLAYGRLLPCPPHHGPLRVEHLVVSEGGCVLDYISKALSLPPLCYEVDWKSRVIAVTDLYVVLNKPAATSVGGTTDNIEESCATFTSRALGLETPLLVTHQIDNCTEGCVVLARTKNFCSTFHGMIREKQVKKLYLTLAAAPVPVGIISHYMRPINIAPRLVSEDHIERWHLCQMDVLECKEVPWPNPNIEKIYNIDGCGWPSKNTAYECRINLLTGKTHQIRAQLAAIGSPIVGDSMYMPAAVAQMANPHVNPFGISGRQYTSEEEKVEAIEEWISCHGKEPAAAIGLQASHISWDDGQCAYEAGTPWWRLTD